jgi:hypothetical protein
MIKNFVEFIKKNPTQKSLKIKSFLVARTSPKNFKYP